MNTQRLSNQKEIHMPQKAWSAKRERQYAHIKDSLIDRGKPLQIGRASCRERV